MLVLLFLYKEKLFKKHYGVVDDMLSCSVHLLYACEIWTWTCSWLTEKCPSHWDEMPWEILPISRAPIISPMRVLYAAISNKPAVPLWGPSHHSEKMQDDMVRMCHKILRRYEDPPAGQQSQWEEEGEGMGGQHPRIHRHEFWESGQSWRQLAETSPVVMPTIHRVMGEIRLDEISEQEWKTLELHSKSPEELIFCIKLQPSLINTRTGALHWNWQLLQENSWRKRLNWQTTTPSIFCITDWL